MKKRPNSIKKIIIFAIGGYLITLGISIAIIIAIPYFEHSDYLKKMAEDITREYEEVGDLEKVDLHTFGALVYDASGSCIYDVMPQNPTRIGDAEDSFGYACKKQLNKVANGETAATIIFSEPIHLSSMIVGKPIYKDGVFHEAFFIVRNLRDLYPTLIAFIIAYSLFFVIASITSFRTLSKRQKYIQMERDYVANFSHDLKSPIASIRALTETMHNKLPEEYAECKCYCDFIIKESIRLENTVADILELSSVQSKQANMTKTHGNLKDFFSATLSKYEMLCYDMMIDFNISDELKKIPSVYTNQKNISRLLDILLSNAVKFVGEEDGIIWLDIKIESTQVVLCVRDNGIGISKTNQKHIFDRFFMGDLSHNSNGSGLGLAIAREIAVALNEQLWVESTPEKGASFYFTVHYK